MKAQMLIITAVILAGCSKSRDADKPASQSRLDRTAQDVVRVVSQSDKIQAGRSAMEKVKQASAEHAKDLEEVGIESK